MEETHIDNLVNEKIKKIKAKKNIFDTGKVIMVKDYIIEVSGLENVCFFEKVNIWEKGMGYVNSIHENYVTIAIVRQYKPIEIGDIVNSTGETFKAIFTEEALRKNYRPFWRRQINRKSISSRKCRRV